MNKLNSFLNSALTATKPILMGVSLSYEGNSVEGIYNTQMQEAELIAGGLNNEFDASFLMNNTDIASAGITTFAKGSRCTLKATDWKIERIEIGDVTTTLYLAGWNESGLNS